MFFKDKVVWITGASSGIGKEIAIQLIQQKAKVVLTARRKERLQELVASFGLEPTHYLILDADLSSHPPYEQMVNQVVRYFGRIDILINNAGLSQKSLALDNLEEVDRKLMEVNFFAPMMLSKAVANAMNKEQGGTIAVVTSILGKFGLPRLATYAAAKHALYGWFSSFRYEMENANINIVLLSPGFVNTDVAVNSITADGKPYNINSTAQENGISPAYCAGKMLRAIEKGKWYKSIGKVELLMPWVNLFFPKLFFRLMQRMSKS